MKIKQQNLNESHQMFYHKSDINDKTTESFDEKVIVDQSFSSSSLQVSWTHQN